MRDELKAYADAVRIEHGLNFSVRMGINSGEVVVGRIGDDLRMDYTAQGHTVGLAQRMAALAEAGKALIAGTTIDLVQGYFALRDLGAMTVKGIERPVRVADRRRRVKININTVSWLLADTFCRRVVPADIRTWGTACLDRFCGGSSALAEGTSSPWKTGWPIDLDLCSPVGWCVVRYRHYVISTWESGEVVELSIVTPNGIHVARTWVLDADSSMVIYYDAEADIVAALKSGSPVDVKRDGISRRLRPSIVTADAMPPDELAHLFDLMSQKYGDRNAATDVYYRWLGRSRDRIAVVLRFDT